MSTRRVIIIVIARQSGIYRAVDDDDITLNIISLISESVKHFPNGREIRTLSYSVTYLFSASFSRTKSRCLFVIFKRRFYVYCLTSSPAVGGVSSRRDIVLPSHEWRWSTLLFSSCTKPYRPEYLWKMLIYVAIFEELFYSYSFLKCSKTTKFDKS